MLINPLMNGCYTISNTKDQKKIKNLKKLAIMSKVNKLY